MEADPKGVCLRQSLIIKEEFLHRGPQQWQVQGRGWGGWQPPLFLDQTEAQRAKKHFFFDRAPPYLSAWMTATHPPPHLALSEGQDPPLLNYLFLIPLGLCDREIIIIIHVI